MIKNILDTDEYDVDVILDAVTLENGIAPLLMDEYSLTNMVFNTVEPVTEKIYVKRNGESNGTIYNSEFAVSKVLSVDDADVLTHVNKRIQTVVSFQEVFNSWHRYAHSWGVDYQPSYAPALDTWTYDSTLNSIISGNDTVTRMHHVGMVSPNALRNYDLDIGLSLSKPSSSGDIDDWLGVVVGFVVDEAGVEHTLTALRSTGATSQPITDDRTRWRPVSGNTTISTTGNDDYHQVALVVDFRTTRQRIIYRDLNVHIGHIWFSSGGSRIHAVKQGKMLTVDWYAMTGKDNNDIVASITVDLDAEEDTKQFKDFVQIGYCAQSQAYGVFTNRVSGGNYVFETSAYGELVNTDVGTVQYGFLADVENEGVDTSTAAINTAPAREVSTDVIRIDYPKDRVTIRYDLVDLTSVMVMDAAKGDFDWYNSATWNDYTSAAPAKDGFKAAAARQGFDTVKLIYNISCTRQTIGADKYLAVKFSSYIMSGDNGTDVAYFKLPA